ncbi:MAG: hypothetical protein WC717_03550 [Candidatus Micrarchaeia archaeon]
MQKPAPARKIARLPMETMKKMSDAMFHPESSLAVLEFAGKNREQLHPDDFEAIIRSALALRATHQRFDAFNKAVGMVLDVQEDKWIPLAEMAVELRITMHPRKEEDLELLFKMRKIARNARPEERLPLIVRMIDSSIDLWRAEGMRLIRLAPKEHQAALWRKSAYAIKNSTMDAPEFMDMMRLLPKRLRGGLIGDAIDSTKDEKRISQYAMLIRIAPKKSKAMLIDKVANAGAYDAALKIVKRVRGLENDGAWKDGANQIKNTIMGGEQDKVLEKIRLIPLVAEKDRAELIEMAIDKATKNGWGYDLFAKLAWTAKCVAPKDKTRVIRKILRHELAQGALDVRTIKKMVAEAMEKDRGGLWRAFAKAVEKSLRDYFLPTLLDAIDKIPCFPIEYRAGLVKIALDNAMELDWRSGPKGIAKRAAEHIRLCEDGRQEELRALYKSVKGGMEPREWEIPPMGSGNG